MHHLFHMTDERQHREHRLDEHTVLPRAALAQFEIGGIALGSMEAGVTQDNHLFFELANEPLKGVIRDISRGTRSEERRVGKECRSRWSTYPEREKNKMSLVRYKV